MAQVKHKRIVKLDLTLSETRTVLHLLEACDDAEPHIFRETSRIAKRLLIADSIARNSLTRTKS